MRIGLFTVAGGAPLDELTRLIQDVGEAGLDSAFVGQTTAFDAITVAALGGQAAPGLEVGTAIVPTYSRHPLTMATQALTAQAMTGGRFTLGVGPSHPQLIERQYGLSYDRPARHVREYLSALRPLLDGEEVDYKGETLTAAGQVDAPDCPPPALIVSALGPVMLRLAGESADGTVTTWTSARAIAEHIVPGITKAAQAAGRPAPRVLAGVVVALTDDPDGARAALAEQLGFAADYPGYRAILDRQGLSGVHETIIAGNERQIATAIREYAEAGATDLLASPLGNERETLALLASLR